MQQELHHRECVNPGANVVQNNSRSFGKTLDVAHRRGLQNVEPTKKYKAREQRFPRHWSKQKSDPLAGNFVDHDELRVLIIRGSRNASCRGNADEYSNQGNDCKNRWLSRNRNPASQREPDQNSSQRCPGAGTWFESAYAEEGCGKRRPNRSGRGGRSG